MPAPPNFDIIARRMPPSPSSNRRQLRFESIEAALADAERLAQAEREGRLKSCGNWTLGQALGHLGTWANFPFDGYPDSLHPPLPVRIIARLLRRKIIYGRMMAGMRIGKLPGGTVGLDVLSTDEGLSRFRTAMQRLRDTPPTIHNPVFGPLTHDQWIQLNLRHAELHLSFHSEPPETTRT
jgi:hypothetical protein